MTALSPKEALTLKANAAKRRAAHKAQPMDKKPGPPDLLRYTAGDSKVARPLKNAPVDYSRAKLTACPSPQFSARWQYRTEAPDERWPSFASVPLGVNPDTGKAWGAAG